MAATIAARFPARATSRVPILAALAGRRPLPPVPRLQWVKALIIFATGVGLLALVAVNAKGGPAANVAAGVAIVGGLLVMAGVAYLTPVVVTLLAKAVGGSGAAARIGARGLVRVRSRSAAIVTAVAIAGTIAIAIVTALLGFGVNREIGRFATDRGIAPNQVLLEDFGVQNGLPPAVDQPAVSARDFTAKQAEVEKVIPRIRFRPVQGFAAVPIVDQSGSAVDIQNRIDGLPGSVRVAIDSPAVRGIVHLTPRGRALLDRDGVVANGTSFGLSSGYESADVRLRVGVGAPFLASLVPGSLTSIDAVMTSARARELGIATAVVATIGTAPSSLTNDQRRALQPDADPYVAAPAVTDPGAGTIQVQSGFDSAGSAFWRGFWTPDNLQRWFAIGALLFVLVVVAIGLLLGASEGRDETDVLEQLGVRPRTGRRMEATKAALLAFGGGVLALPAGFIPLAVVFRSVQKPSDYLSAASGGSVRAILYPQIVFPWITAIGIVVVIPLVAALGAWVASAIAQRAQAFRGTLAFDAD